MRSHRPHLRVFLSWLIVLVGLGLAGGRLAIPSASDAQAASVFGSQRATTEVVDHVDHTVEHFAGLPTERSIARQLMQLGVTVDPRDRVTAFPDPSLGLGDQLTIERATHVTVHDGRTVVNLTTWQSTVSAVLTEARMTLGDQDKIDKDINSTVVDKMTISITRVAVTDIEETEAIAYQTTTVDDPSMERGQRNVIVAGHDGVRTKRYRVRRENGEQVEKTLVSSEVTTAPVTHKVAVGTHVTVYGTGTATWYGLLHGFGAASNVLPYGTRVHVVNTANGKSVDVTINDHGIQGSAVIDLDAEAFAEIAPLSQGVASVRLEKISN